jgi:hypothetical protein
LHVSHPHFQLNGAKFDVSDAHEPSASPRVCALYIYPVKGARAIALASAEVLRGGLRHDRRFMVIDETGRFLTQREHPRLALIETAIEGDTLALSIASEPNSRLRVPLEVTGAERTVTVWKDTVTALDAGPEAARLFTQHLGMACSLVRMPSSTIRQVDRQYAHEGDRVGFADGFPVLIASLSSLADLNARLERPIGIDRFRPNIVIEGAEAWAEEAATHVRIGGGRSLTFRTPKKCGRCVVTTTDQRTGEVTGKEPLRTLAMYRREGQNANFAMNAIPDGEGRIAVGDAVVLMT